MAVTAFADEVRRVRRLGVGTSDIAAAAGRSRRPSTPGRARRGGRPAPSASGSWSSWRWSIGSSASCRRGYVPLWLLKPVPALDDRRPLELLSKGRYRDVSKLVAELENESFS